MLSTVKLPTADIPAFEEARPFFRNHAPVFFLMSPLALLLIITVAAEDVFLNLPTVAASRYPNFTSSAETFVTWTFAEMLATRH